MSVEPTPAVDRSFFGHPRGLAVLFFTEMWERFGFYGMRALLILYLTASLVDGGMGLDASRAAGIYALFTSMVYLLGLPGGWFADRIVGQRRAVLYGGILISAGYLCMAVPSVGAFYLGLGLVALGTGLLKPNVSAIVGQLYTPDDERRDAGFSLFYMGINFGAFGGPIVCGFLGERIDWHLGFGAAGVGMALGLVLYVWGGSALGQAGIAVNRPGREPGPTQILMRRLGLWGLGLVVLLFAFLGWTGRLNFSIDAVANSFGLVLLIVTVVFFSWLFLAGEWTRLERGRLAATLVLFLAATFFWAAYEQAGSSLNLFARDLTDRTIRGFEFPASWFQPVPALFVIILAPVFAWLWLRLGPRQPSSPAKFALGLVFVGLGFGVMVVASSVATVDGPVGPNWLVLTYLLHVIGEMCLSPVGLSTVTKLAPARVTGLMMGVWFLASAVGNYIGGRTAGLYEMLPLWGLFGLIAVTTIGAGLLLGLLVRPIRRLMGGVH